MSESQAVRSGDESDERTVFWGLQEAPYTLFPLALTDWDTCPDLSFWMGTEQSCFRGASGCPLTGSDHSGKRGPEP